MLSLGAMFVISDQHKIVTIKSHLIIANRSSGVKLENLPEQRLFQILISKPYWLNTVAI